MNKKIKKTKIKIFFGLTEIAGYYSNLQKGFNQLGIFCSYISLDKNRFLYSNTVPKNKIIRILVFLHAKINISLYSSWIKRKTLVVSSIVIRCLIFLWALFKHDIFIFAAGTSFLGYNDFFLIKLLKKKIICVSHGSDTRPPYIDGAVIKENKNFSIDDCVNKIKKRKDTVKKIDKYADIIIDSPSWGHFHERAFVSWFAIGIPYSGDVDLYYIKEKTDQNTQFIRILHAPSQPDAKGTKEIRNIIEILKAKGFLIKYVEISGKPHSQVLNELVYCDFVIDQMYASFLMAGLATEAAFFGKPTIVGSYYANQIYNDVPPKFIPPTLFCHPNELLKATEKMIRDENFRITLGEKAKKFVETNWIPYKVALRYVKVINGDIPKDWIFEPNNIKYVNGGCISEKRAKEIVKTLIETKGIESLKLEDKPELKEMFKVWAYK